MAPQATLTTRFGKILVEGCYDLRVVDVDGLTAFGIPYRFSTFLQYSLETGSVSEKPNRSSLTSMRRLDGVIKDPSWETQGKVYLECLQAVQDYVKRDPDFLRKARVAALDDLIARADADTEKKRSELARCQDHALKLWNEREALR